MRGDMMMRQRVRERIERQMPWAPAMIVVCYARLYMRAYYAIFYYDYAMRVIMSAKDA